MTEMRIVSEMGETESGLPWPVSTRINNVARVSGWGEISYTGLDRPPMSSAEARQQADKLDALAVALRAAADWADEHADELKGYDR